MRIVPAACVPQVPGPSQVCATLAAGFSRPARCMRCMRCMRGAFLIGRVWRHLPSITVRVTSLRCWNGLAGGAGRLATRQHSPGVM